MERLLDLFQELSQQMPWKGTLVLDTTELRIMDPRVAELFIPAFTKCMLDKELKALAHVGSPENVVLRLQFERVLNDVEGADRVRHESFTQHGEAEQRLDSHD